MEYTALERALTEYGRAYFDNSVLTVDINRKEVLTSCGGSRDHIIHSVVLRFGAALNFREVKYRPLVRQAVHAARLYYFIAEHTKIRSVPRVVAEYARSINAFENSRDFLVSHSSTRKRGSKQEALEEAIRYHQLTYELLSERSTVSKISQRIAAAMREQRMHLPREGGYVKRRGKTKEEASIGDTELAAEALAHAVQNPENVAVITGDLDLANLIRNFGALLSRNSLPLPLCDLSLQGNVDVYFPSNECWVPQFGVRKLAEARITETAGSRPHISL